VARSLRLVIVVCLPLAAVLAAAGCGTGGLVSTGDASSGKKLFQTKCGFCHALADAGTQGKAGPDLDNAFAGVRAQGFKEDTIREVVADQIRLPGQFPGGNSMPANIVRGADLVDVSTYVAAVAGAQGYTSAAPAAGAATTGGGGGGNGKALFASLGCQGCHTIDGSPATGPSFKGLFGATVKLKGGQTVKADDAYLMEAIIDPDKQIVEGYAPGVMTALIKPHQVSEADAKALVDFIKSLK
jgi:cytochrome c2